MSVSKEWIISCELLNTLIFNDEPPSRNKIIGIFVNYHKILGQKCFRLKGLVNRCNGELRLAIFKTPPVLIH